MQTAAYTLISIPCRDIYEQAQRLIDMIKALVSNTVEPL